MQIGHDKAAHIDQIQLLKIWAQRQRLYSNNLDRAKIVPCRSDATDSRNRVCPQECLRLPLERDAALQRQPGHRRAFVRLVTA
jgi:hypothetical protein